MRDQESGGSTGAFWEQPRLFPPEAFRIDVTVFIPTDGSCGTIGTRVTTFPDDDLIETTVVLGVQLDHADELAARDMRNLVRTYLREANPFP